MCVRYACDFSAQDITCRLDITAINTNNQQPRYNVAPRTKNPVVHIHSNQYTLDYLQWGLDPQAKLSTFNCRVESLEDLKPIWQCAKTQRGVAIMNGYYEWQYEAIDRIPYYFHTQSEMTMALAIWKDNSYSIVTKPASKALEKVHPRMPILVDWDIAQKWIKGDWPKVLELVNQGIEPRYYRVSKAVNKVQSQGPALIKKVATMDLGVWANSKKHKQETENSESQPIPSKRQKRVNTPESNEPDLHGEPDSQHTNKAKK